MSTSHPREPVRFLVFSASLRAASLNTRLADLATETIDANGGEVDRAGTLDFECPPYNADVQNAEGFPAGAEEFRRRLDACDAFVCRHPSTTPRYPACSRTRSTGCRAFDRSRSTSARD